MYFFPVLLLVLAFDAHLPLMTGAFLISLIAVICAACNWWSMDKMQRGIGWLAAYLIVQHLVFRNTSTLGGKPGLFDLLGDSTVFNYPGLVAAAIIAAGVAILGVEKQRHGDAINISSLAVPW